MKESTKAKKKGKDDAKGRSQSKKDKKPSKPGGHKHKKRKQDCDNPAEVKDALALAQNWASMARATASTEVLLFTSAEALQNLPARYASFHEASLPENSAERCGALLALADIATGFSPTELGLFVRSLELALLERSRQEPAPSRPARALPLVQDAPVPTPPPAMPPPPPPVPTPAVLPLPPPAPQPPSVPLSAPAESADSQPSQQGEPAEPEHPEKDSESSSSSETSEDEKAKAQARAAQKKADAEAADKVYEICRALPEKPCQVDGQLQPDNVRWFVRELLLVASQPLHWEQAWSRMGMPESLRPEAGIAFLQNLVDFAAEPERQLDAAKASAMAIAALSKGHRLKMNQVEDFLIARLDSVQDKFWEVLSWLLFHWFPQSKSAGWGWWRVGWSLSQWWKLVDRILCRAVETGHSQDAFIMLKTALCRMQARRKSIFRKMPFDDERRRQLTSRLSSLLPGNLPEDELRKKLEPLRV